MLDTISLKVAGSIVAACLAVCVVPAALAQDVTPEVGDSPTASDDPNSALEREKEEAVLRADIAEAKKRETLAEVEEAKAGAGETDQLEGTVTLNEGAGYFSEILAYRSLDGAACNIARKVTSATKDTGKAIVLTDQIEIAELSARWNLVLQQLNVIEQTFQRTGLAFTEDELDSRSRESSAAGSLISASLSSIADIAGYFREDTELTKFNLALNNKALLAEVSAAILDLKKDAVVVIPSMSYGTNGVIVSRLDQLLIKRNELEKRRKKIKDTNKDVLQKYRVLVADRSKKKAEKAALEAKKPVDAAAVAAKQAEIKKADEAVKKHEDDKAFMYAQSAEKKIPAVIKLYDDLVKALTTAPKSGEKAPLERLAQLDLLRAYPDAFFLYVSIVGQGGEVQVTNSIWTGGRISYIGGSTSVFFLTDKDGRVAAAGSPSEYHKAWYGQRAGVGKIKTNLGERNTTASESPKICTAE